MKWRKLNRMVHRELGYVFFGMAIIYGFSGIALNHHIARHWTPSTIEKSMLLEGVLPVSKSEVDKTYIQNLLSIAGELDNYKQYYFPTDDLLLVYLKNGHIDVNLSEGKAVLTKVRNRRFFRDINFLHYNKPKQLWTYFSDLFAASLIILAISGLFMVRGKKGISGKNGILVILGMVIPLLFLFFYLWT